MSLVRLPRADRGFEPYQLQDPKDFPATAQGPFNRLAFAAAHVVHDRLAEHDPWLDVAIDWEGTLAYRRHLWGLGFAVAEAMDTAQRGMGLDWTTALELIRRSVADAKHVPGAVVFSGAGTDHLPPAPGRTIDEVIAAYEEQVAAVEGAGGRLVLADVAVGDGTPRHDPARLAAAYAAVMGHEPRGSER